MYAVPTERTTQTTMRTQQLSRLENLIDDFQVPSSGKNHPLPRQLLNCTALSIHAATICQKLLLTYSASLQGRTGRIIFFKKKKNIEPDQHDHFNLIAL